MKNKLYKQNKGITLIALVITIIVLLILAGVAISMLSGENGILKKTAESKEKTEEASDLEKVQLAVISALTEGLGTVDIADTTGNTKGSLYKALADDGITGYTGNGIVKYNGKTYVVSENGTVGTKKFTAANYGDLVNYNVNIDGDTTNADWQVFYDDGTNVYLIAKDYINWGEVTTNAAGMSTSGYYAWWNDVPELGEEYANGNCVASLLQQENWIDFKDTDGKAEYAIGAPKLDMWVASWNEKNGINPIAYPKLYAENTGTYGYYVGTEAGLKDIADDYDETKGGYFVSLSSYGSESDKTGYYDALYFNDRTENNTNRYWLASPSADGERFLMHVDYDGYVDCDGNYNYNLNCGVRPLVSLKSNVQFEKVGNVWNITE